MRYDGDKTCDLNPEGCRLTSKDKTRTTAHVPIHLPSASDGHLEEHGGPGTVARTNVLFIISSVHVTSATNHLIIIDLPYIDSEPGLAQDMM